MPCSARCRDGGGCRREVHPLGQGDPCSRAGALLLETLFFADDVRSKAEIEEGVAATAVKKPELALAKQVIDSLVGEWKAEDFENEYRRDLKTMLEAKLAGETVVRPEPVAETPVIDLMEALRRSVAEVQDRKSNGSAAKAAKKTKATPSEGGSRSRRAPARKSAWRPACPEGLVVLRQRAERLELDLEEVLVDLAVVDRDPFLHADPDHLLLVDAELLSTAWREAFAIRSFPVSAKNPAGAERFRRLFLTRLSFRRASVGLSRQSIHHPENMPLDDGVKLELSHFEARVTARRRSAISSAVRAATVLVHARGAPSTGASSPGVAASGATSLPRASHGAPGAASGGPDVLDPYAEGPPAVPEQRVLPAPGRPLSAGPSAYAAVGRPEAVTGLRSRRPPATRPHAPGPDRRCDRPRPARAVVRRHRRRLRFPGWAACSFGWWGVRVGLRSGGGGVPRRRAQYGHARPRSAPIS